VPARVPPVPTTNEKWVGTCPPVPYGFGAYDLSHSFLRLSSLLIRHSRHLHNFLRSFTLGLKPASFTNPSTVVSLSLSGLMSLTIIWTVSSELYRFLFLVQFRYFFCSVSVW